MNEQQHHFTPINSLSCSHDIWTFSIVICSFFNWVQRHVGIGSAAPYTILLGANFKWSQCGEKVPTRRRKDWLPRLRSDINVSTLSSLWLIAKWSCWAATLCSDWGFQLRIRQELTEVSYVLLRNMGCNESALLLRPRCRQQERGKWSVFVGVVNGPVKGKQNLWHTRRFWTELTSNKLINTRTTASADSASLP